jgi:hypothetical protein
LVNLDDVVIGLNHAGLQFTMNPSISYWIAISWIYPVYSALSSFSLANWAIERIFRKRLLHRVLIS